MCIDMCVPAHDRTTDPLAARGTCPLPKVMFVAQSTPSFVLEKRQTTRPRQVRGGPRNSNRPNALPNTAKGNGQAHGRHAPHALGKTPPRSYRNAATAGPGPAIRFVAK